MEGALQRYRLMFPTASLLRNLTVELSHFEEFKSHSYHELSLETSGSERVTPLGQKRKDQARRNVRDRAVSSRQQRSWPQIKPMPNTSERASEYAIARLLASHLTFEKRLIYPPASMQSLLTIFARIRGGADARDALARSPGLASHRHDHDRPAIETLMPMCGVARIAARAAG